MKRKALFFFLPGKFALLLAPLIAAWPLASRAAVDWEGATGGTPGDGLNWSDPFNWQLDAVPAPADDVTFGDPATAGSTVHLNLNRTVNSLAFDENFLLGAPGTNLLLTNTTGNVTVSGGDFVHLNTAYGGANGLNLSGGGSLYLTNPLSPFSGSINVDGAGTTLVHRQEGPSVQYSGINAAAEFGRYDPVNLGYRTAVQTVNLTNGGVYKILQTGNNPETNNKNIAIGAGGGTLNIAAGYIVQNLDDAGQITAGTNTFTLAGRGRLSLGTGPADANVFGGIVNVNGGILGLDRLQGGGAAGTRFAGIAAAGTTLNINSGGVLMVNNGTQGRLDVPTVNLNNGGILAVNGQDHIIGIDAGGTTLSINGTATLLSRDLFNAQQERLPRLRTNLTGSGILEIRPNANTGGNPRVVIERNTDLTGFTGTFRLMENQALEAIPRFNVNGAISTNNSGRMIGFGDIEFAGWNSRFDVRENSGTAGNPAVLDYTQNDLRLTSTQPGAVATLATNLGDGTALAVGQMFHFGNLSMSNQRLIVQGNNGFHAGISGTAAISGNAVILMNTDNVPLVFSNAAAISEDAAGRSLTLLKSGGGTSAQRDVIVGGAVSLSNLEVATGNLQLRGALGAIGLGAAATVPTITINGGMSNNSGNGNPTPGVLHLDSNTGHVVGATTVIAAANNNDRIVDSATINMRGNSVLRLTSLNNTGTTETVGRTNVSGHATFDVINTGVTPSPVALTITTLNLAGTKPTVNFTANAQLGQAGADTSRIVIAPPAGTPTGFMGSQFHSGGEWAKYDNTIDNGFELGVAAFAAADYTIDATATDAGWAAGQQLKLTSATGTVMSANRNVNRVNLQMGANNQSINLAGFVLTMDEGGLLAARSPSGETTGIIDGATAAVPSGTAGITSSTGEIYAHTQSNFDLRTPVTGAIDFVKSGTGNMRLIHQDLAVGTGATAINPFTAATWSSTLTGSWIINDGRLDVHRGQFLGGRPVVLNGGHLEINEPVSNANADSIIPGWGNNIIVNGNASVGTDDNGESADGNTGDRAMVRLGSLTINNGSILGTGGFSDQDTAFMGGATFSGTPTLNLIRGGANSATIINGTLAGSGFNSVALAGNNGSVVLGGGMADSAANTYNGAITMYAGTLRPNKANGTLAITDGAAAEDVVIIGGSLLWGPGQHGDLLTTNNINTTNNGLIGIHPLSPAAVLAAGQHQIADTANITLLLGTLGESDRITNEKFGTLTMRNGTMNVGLGTLEMDSATISGGAIGFDRGGTWKTGSLTYLPGAPDQNIFTGRPVAGAYTTIEVGSGGLNMNGQFMTVGSGFFNNNVMGAGGRLILGGPLTYNGTDLIGGSYGRKGIYISTGNSFRELGASHIDLAGGIRDVNIGTDSLFTITLPIRNGGITKNGGGGLVLEPYQRSSFSGPVTINGGTLVAKGDGAFGTGAGGLIINSGGTAKLDTGWDYAHNISVAGRGANIPGDTNVFEYGAIVADGGTSRLFGSFTLTGNATIAGSNFIDPSITPGTSGTSWRVGRLEVKSPAGIQGSGTLSISGNGDGTIPNGVNTLLGGLTKDGSGRWTIGAGSFTGTTTIAAGNLRITDSTALGSPAAGTTVTGGSLELTGGISTPEPLRIFGAGSSSQSGAVVNVSGSNTLSGSISLGGAATLRSDAGTLTVAGVSVTGASTLTLSGAGNGRISSGVSVGGGGGALLKEGTGSWQISGSGVNTGSTRVNGGSLEIASAGALLDPASPLIMGGGHLRVTGSAQTSNGLNLVEGGGTVNGGAGLTVGAISRSTGATANFAGTVTTGTPNTNGILGSYATYGGNWAVGGGTISAFTGYTPLANSTGTVGTGNHGNYDYDANGYSNSVHTVAIGGETLRVASGIKGLATGANNITLGMGGLLRDGSSDLVMGGSGILSGATANDELVMHVNGGRLTTNMALIGAGTGSLTKTGAGELRLFATSNFTGSINVNGGDLIVPGGVAFPGVLGAAPGGGANRLLNINGGSFGILSDWDINDFDAAAGVQSIQLNIGPAGGTLKALYGANLNINDGSPTAAGADQQLRGSGDLTFAGGGRYNLTGGTPQFLTFTGNTTVDGGVLMLGHSNSLGGRQEQTITLRPGSAIINQTGYALGLAGLPNNIVASGGGVEFFSLDGNRVYNGDIQLGTGTTNTIYLAQRDTPQQERQLYFNGRVSGSGVTLDVMGANNGNPFYLASGANDLTGNINLNANAVMEVRQPGSLGSGPGDVNVNLNGANSRLLIRHWQNGDYRANVNVSAAAEINADRLANYGGGANQLLSINNLTTNTDNILTIGGGNAYTARVGGTANFKANTPINATNNLLLENGITFTNGATILDKRGGGSVILRGPSDHTGATIIQGGFLILQDGGTLPNTSRIDLRGGELRVDNSTATNANRLNDAAALSLGGGTFRLTGVETLGNVTAASGTTVVINNPINETVPNPLTLTGFTRQTGAVVQFQVPDSGAAGAVGMTSFGQTRVGSRILIPGQADTTQTIPGFLGNNNIDFIQYDGTTLDNGVALGVRDMRNPGNLQSPANYSDNLAEGSWTDSIILRRTNPTDATTVTDTLTVSRALDAIKVETGGTNRDYTIAMGANNLRIEGGGIVVVGNTTADFTVTGTGTLTAGPAVPGAGIAELIIGGNGTNVNGTININAVIGNNGSQSVALVKTGVSQLNLNSPAANTYSGGTFVNSGTLNTLVNNALGGAANPINLNGGTLLFNIPNAATVGDLGVPDHPVNVNANSQITLDNGALAGTDNDITLGPLSINGPYTLRLFSFDSMDASFTGTHTFAGTPTIDMIQAGSGGNQTGFFTLNGAIAGSGFNVGNSGGTDNTTSVLQIGGGSGDTAANTYSGPVRVLLGVGSTGAFTDDLLVQLNKAAGTTAITGDLEINGGRVRNMASNQIADTSNVTVNWGQYDVNAQNETVASVTMTGGSLLTSPTTGTPAASAFNVTGPVTVNGLDDVTGGITTGFTIGNNNTTTVGGLLTISNLGRVHLAEGATAAVLNVNGGLQMTGSLLSQSSGAGPNIVRLNSDVTTLASPHPSRIGSSTDSDTFLELNGVRQFTVADGGAGIDLELATVIRNSTSPATTGGFYKTGTGTLQIAGGATGNSYTGDTTVSQGSLVLFKNTGVNSIPGNLFISDGNGPASVVVRNNNQIADTSDVTIGATGVLDLQSFNTNEAVRNLGGSTGGVTTLGPTSVLTVNSTANTTYAGSILGGGDAAGAVIKTGPAKWSLTGNSEYAGDTMVNAGTLEVDGFLNGTEINVAGSATLGGYGTVADVVVNSAGNLSPGHSPGVLTTRNVTMLAGSFSNIEIGGINPGNGLSNHDQLISRGSISLAGDLNVSLVSGYLPNDLDIFLIWTNDLSDAVNGTFSNLPTNLSIIGVPETAITNDYWEIRYDTPASEIAGADGNDIRLIYHIPEPGSVALTAAAAALALSRRRRKV